MMHYIVNIIKRYLTNSHKGKNIHSHFFSSTHTHTHIHTHTHTHIYIYIYLYNNNNNESWRLEETCCLSNSSEKPSANTDVKNSNNNKCIILSIL